MRDRVQQGLRAQPGTAACKKSRRGRWALSNAAAGRGSRHARFHFDGTGRRFAVLDEPGTVWAARTMTLVFGVPDMRCTVVLSCIMPLQQARAARPPGS